MNAFKPLAALSILAILSGCSGKEPAVVRSDPPTSRQAASPEAAAVGISIDNFTFAPQTVTIPAGAKVVWTNHDDVPHTIKGTNSPIASKALDTDDTFTHVFSVPGQYDYFCGIHPHMTGRVIVK
jgi:plastocyanin